MARPIRTVAICVPQVPFFTGGAERLASGLRDALRGRGFEADVVSVPFRWNPHEEIERHCLAWRLLDLSWSNGRRIDLVIATKFPSYVVQHERKVTWLVHQFRQVYDLLGTPYSDFGDSPDDLALRERIARIDRHTLSESRRLFSISRTVAARLLRWNGLEARPLHHPPPGHERFRVGEAGDYVLSVGRLEAIKRVAPLIEALRHSDRGLRCVVAGSGPEEAALRALAAEHGVDGRVEFVPRASFEELVSLYAGALAVYYAPFQEDYGYVTLEAFLSGKPVLTAPDAGGVLEFVEPGANGLVSELEPEILAESLRKLDADRAWAAELGRAGRARALRIDWDTVVDRLVAG